MICYSKLHDRPFLLNTSTKASGVVAVFVAIDQNDSVSNLILQVLKLYLTANCRKFQQLSYLTHHG